MLRLRSAQVYNKKVLPGTCHFLIPLIEKGGYSLEWVEIRFKKNGVLLPFKGEFPV
jgi:hypothetical protein